MGGRAFKWGWCLGLRGAEQKRFSLGVKNVPKPNNNNRAILDYFYFVDPAGGQKSEQWHLLTIGVALKLQSQITSTAASATTQSAFLWHLPNRILCFSIIKQNDFLRSSRSRRCLQQKKKSWLLLYKSPMKSFTSEMTFQPQICSFTLWLFGES